MYEAPISADLALASSVATFRFEESDLHPTTNMRVLDEQSRLTHEAQSSIRSKVALFVRSKWIIAMSALR
jgi:hypothetical protein